MSEFKKLSVSECADRLLALTDVAVAMHVRPDGDTVGSAAALMYVFHKLGKAPLWLARTLSPRDLNFCSRPTAKRTATNMTAQRS